MANNLLEQIRQYDEERDFLRQCVIPEEDRPRFTSANGVVDIDGSGPPM